MKASKERFRRRFLKERILQENFSSMNVNTEPDLKLESVSTQTKTVPCIKILLADTDRRPYTARLAMAFAAAGCEVSAVCTSHNPINAVRARPQLFPYSAVSPKLSLLHAIQSANPDLIVPCDDRAVLHLQQLCGQAGLSPSVVRVIERSLGPSGSFPVVSARYPLLELAREQGIRVPATQYLQTPQDLEEWRTKQPFPWVLKADGTWGGGGVKVAETDAQVVPLFSSLGQPCKLKSAIKRLLVYRDPFYLREWWQRTSRPLIAQAYIAGRPANCAVACWKGRVLSQTNVEVLATADPTGPAKIVRLVDNPAMTVAAKRIAEKLELSGFFGLDFVIEDGTEDTYLIEMNPRCTPLTHVQFGSTAGLVTALCSAFLGLPAEASSSPSNFGEVIAYFPQAHGAKDELNKTAFYDIPHDEPELAEALLYRFPKQTLLYRIADSLSSR
jgi:hypothetical protein